MFFFSCPGFALKEDGILSHYVLDILGKQWPDFFKGSLHQEYGKASWLVVDPP